MHLFIKQIGGMQGAKRRRSRATARLCNAAGRQYGHKEMYWLSSTVPSGLQHLKVHIDFDCEDFFRKTRLDVVDSERSEARRAHTRWYVTDEQRRIAGKSPPRCIFSDVVDH